MIPLLDQLLVPQVIPQVLARGMIPLIMQVKPKYNISNFTMGGIKIIPSQADFCGIALATLHHPLILIMFTIHHHSSPLVTLPSHLTHITRF